MTKITPPPQNPECALDTIIIFHRTEYSYSLLFSLYLAIFRVIIPYNHAISYFYILYRREEKRIIPPPHRTLITPLIQLLFLS